MLNILAFRLISCHLFESKDSEKFIIYQVKRRKRHYDTSLRRRWRYMSPAVVPSPAFRESFHLPLCSDQPLYGFQSAPRFSPHYISKTKKAPSLVSFCFGGRYRTRTYDFSHVKPYALFGKLLNMFFETYSSNLSTDFSSIISSR